LELHFALGNLWTNDLIGLSQGITELQILDIQVYSGESEEEVINSDGVYRIPDCFNTQTHLVEFKLAAAVYAEYFDWQSFLRRVGNFKKLEVLDVYLDDLGEDEDRAARSKKPLYCLTKSLHKMNSLSELNLRGDGWDYVFGG
jgi:hypothetical protein